MKTNPSKPVDNKKAPQPKINMDTPAMTNIKAAMMGRKRGKR